MLLSKKYGIIGMSFDGSISPLSLDRVSHIPSDMEKDRHKDNPMLKTHKIALNPNNVQATQFAQHCGYARVAYNHALSDFKAGLDTDQWRSHSELCKRFNAIKREQYITSGAILQLLIMRCVKRQNHCNPFS